MDDTNSNSSNVEGTRGAVAPGAGGQTPAAAPVQSPPPARREGGGSQPGFLLFALNLCLLAAACWYVWHLYTQAQPGGAGSTDGAGQVAGQVGGPGGRTPGGVRGGGGGVDVPRAGPRRSWGESVQRSIASADTGGGNPRPPEYDAQTLERLGATERLLGELGVELEVVRAIRGAYPTSADGQGANRGIEAVVAALSESRRMPEGVRTEDTDGDGRPELVDPWGHALVYFSTDDYGSAQQVGGDSVTASTPRSALMAAYHAPGRFQMWSLGPDGKNDGGLGDDIRSWVIHE